MSTSENSFKGVKVLALMATHNRVGLTLECLKRLFLAAASVAVELEVCLVDGGSTDLTVDRVRSQFPQVRVFSVDSNKYWAESMRIAWENSIEVERDYILWINDDVSIHTNFFEVSLAFLSVKGKNAIACGVTQERRTDAANYGGYRAGPWYRRLRLTRLEPKGEWEPVDVANGNILLIPDSVDKSLRGFPKGFRHGMADFYYTARANKKGFQVYQSPHPVGVCETNRAKSGWEDNLAPLRLRLADLVHPKHFPVIPWLKFTFSVGGISAPIYSIQPLLRVFSSWTEVRFKRIFKPQ